MDCLKISLNRGRFLRHIALLPSTEIDDDWTVGVWLSRQDVTDAPIPRLGLSFNILKLDDASHGSTRSKMRWAL